MVGVVAANDGGGGSLFGRRTKRERGRRAASEGEERGPLGGSWHRGGVRGRLGNASVEAGGGHGERARDSKQPACSGKRRKTTRSQVGWVSELGRTGFARLGCYSGGLCR